MPEHRRPQVILFDVNETLSDMTPMADRFAEVGAPAHLAATWFAALLRDGIALTAAGATAPMAEIGATLLRTQLAAQPLDRDLDAAVEHVMSGFTGLAVHPDVVEGVLALSELGIRLATLSNGSADIARGLLERADIADRFERLLSVDQAGTWKPAAGAYAYALAQCGVVAPDAMLVAVHPWDIDGAARAGLSTGWLNRKEEDYPGYFHPPAVEAASLPELARTLGSLRAVTNR
ncbi:MAG TPA: haloacid dehalogenase type II [Marmoricola sp.]|nr:haloacid dehalogenase type II [Marmoricola sp.]